MVFYMVVQLMNTYFVGHSNDPVLIAGVGMGNMLINVFAFAVMQGLNGALESLVSVSFGASEVPDISPKEKEFRRRQCGALHNRARFVSTCVMVPLIILYSLSDKILIGIKQDVGVSVIARNYAVVMIPGVWAMGQFDATKRFLSSQERAAIPVVTQIVTTILHYAWLVIFVNQLGLKEYGMAIATDLTYILNMVIADIWLRVRSKYEFKDMIFFYDRSTFDW